MAVPTTRTATLHTSTASDSTTPTITYPTGMASGDILYASVTTRGSEEAVPADLTGWVELFDFNSGGTGGNHTHTQIWRKIYSSAPPASETWNFYDVGTTTPATGGLSAGLTIIAVAVVGGDTTTPEDVDESTFDGTITNTSITFPSAIPTAAGDHLQLCFGSFNSGGDASTALPFSIPTGLTKLTEGQSSAQSAAVAFSKSHTTSDATGTFTSDVNQSGGLVDGRYATTTILVNPSAGGGDTATITKVEARLNSGAWVQATGTTNWSVDFDVNDFVTGQNTIEARAYNQENIAGEIVQQTVWHSPNGLYGAANVAGDHLIPLGVQGYG